MEAQAAKLDSDEEQVALEAELEEARQRVASAEQRVEAARELVATATEAESERLLDLAQHNQDLEEARAAVDQTLLAERNGDAGTAGIGVADVPTE